MEKYLKKYRRLVFLLVFTAASMIIGIIAGLIFIRPVFTSSACYLVTDTSGLHNEIVHPAEIREFFKHDYFLSHLAENEKVKEKFTTGDLKRMVKLTASRTSPTFKVKVTCKNSTDVYFIHKIIEMAPRKLTGEMSDEIFLVINIESADFPESPKRPGFLTLVFIFALIGAAGSVWFIHTHESMFRQTSVVESVIRFKVPVIAKIPTHQGYGFSAETSEFTKNFLKKQTIVPESARKTDTSAYNPDRNTIMINSKTSVEFFDAFRDFYTNLSEINEPQSGLIIFTSPEIGDGKTTAAINLGITAAAQGKSVLLIDCNLRNRRLTRAFNMDRDTPGLYDMVFEHIPVKDAILFTEYHSLFVLPQGNSRNINPLTLLTRPETLSHLRNIKNMFDYVIVDTPPVNAYSDALALTEAADLVFMVIRSGVTHDDETERALKSLELSEVKVNGIVLNDVPLFHENHSPLAPDLKNISKNKFISGFGI